jgi:hypothetical protein
LQIFYNIKTFALESANRCSDFFFHLR